MSLLWQRDASACGDEAGRFDQWIKIIRDKYLIDAVGYNKIKGTPITRTELVTAIKEMIIAH